MNAEVERVRAAHARRRRAATIEAQPAAMPRFGAVCVGGVWTVKDLDAETDGLVAHAAPWSEATAREMAAYLREAPRRVVQFTWASEVGA